MSNPVGTQASREEEIAFLALEQVLGVEIVLADAGAGDKVADGIWALAGNPKLRGVVEITSPPATELIKEWAAAKRERRSQSESGSVPLRLGELSEVCAEMLSESWALENIDKLLAQQAAERHLFLFGRSHAHEHYFFRLSDTFAGGTYEHVDNLTLPKGISDVWFRGRSRRDPPTRQGTTETRLARYGTATGWTRHIINIEERHLPPPGTSIADDPVPAGWRQPKNRSQDLPRVHQNS